MPAPVPVPIRQAIWALHQQGVSSGDLAERFGLAARTVRGLIRRGRERGAGGLAPDPTHPGQPSPEPRPAREAALRLRREHPTWGAGVIRVWLERSGVAGLPGVREIQRWFAAAGLNPAPRGRRPQSARRPALAAHETWQVDAAERMALADGSQASWLRVTDEATGAVLLTAVFPPRALGPGARG
jgi:transposase